MLDYCAICFDNQANSATLSEGVWQVNQPLSNLLNANVKKVARTNNDSNLSTKFRFVLPANYGIGVLGLMNTNASTAAQFRWKLFSDAGYTTEIYSSDVLSVYPLGTLPFGSIPWGAPNWWSGNPTVAEINRFQRNLIHVLSGLTFARYGQLEIFDTENPDGYFQAGRLFIGQVFQPSEMNMEHGVAIQIKSRTDVTRANSGVKYFNPKTPDLSFAFSLPRLTESEAMRLQDMQAMVDVHGEVLFIWDPTTPEYWFRRSVFGQLAELDPIRHPMYANWANSFQIEGNL